MLTEKREVQPSKAYSPIAMSPSGKRIEEREVQPLKGRPSDFSELLGECDVGEGGAAVKGPLVNGRHSSQNNNVRDEFPPLVVLPQDLPVAREVPVPIVRRGRLVVRASSCATSAPTRLVHVLLL